MRESLEKVIERFILPQFPSILSFNIEAYEENVVILYVIGGEREKVLRTVYVVTFKFKDEKSRKKYHRKVEREVVSFFDMVGPEREDKIVVYSVV